MTLEHSNLIYSDIGGILGTLNVYQALFVYKKCLWLEVYLQFAICKKQLKGQFYKVNFIPK